MKILGEPINGFWFPYLGWQWHDCADYQFVEELQGRWKDKVKVFVFEWFGFGITFLIDLDSIQPRK